MQVREIKNGRLAMIAIGGITHHYFLTGKGPIEFITQVDSSFQPLARGQFLVLSSLCGARWA